MSVWDRIERRVRRLLGRGWGASEFIKRYAANYSDAWGTAEIRLTRSDRGGSWKAFGDQIRSDCWNRGVQRAS